VSTDCVAMTVVRAEEEERGGRLFFRENSNVRKLQLDILSLFICTILRNISSGHLPVFATFTWKVLIVKSPEK
jgi:hypothetical protein